MEALCASGASPRFGRGHESATGASSAPGLQDAEGVDEGNASRLPVRLIGGIAHAHSGEANDLTAGFRQEEGAVAGGEQVGNELARRRGRISGAKVLRDRLAAMEFERFGAHGVGTRQIGQRSFADGDLGCGVHRSQGTVAYGGVALVMAVDLRALVSRGPGIVWNASSEDLNLNLMSLDPGGAIAEHVNDAVDVLLVVIEGQGIVDVDGRQEQVGPGQLVLIPRGARRSIRAGAERFAYLMCHRRRPGLWPGAPQRSER